MSWRNTIGKNLKELRVVFCQNSGASSGARNFIASNYLPVKSSNPNFPFIVRECEGAQPTVMARYSYGVEVTEFAENLSQEQIEEIVAGFVDSADEINRNISL